MQIQTKQLGILAALFLLMAVTRGSHFGSSINLPDASLAIFMVAGFMLPRYTLAALAAFIFLLLEAGGIDYYAINLAGVDDYCVSPAYWFLIPTYASMWFAGHWFAGRQHNNWHSLALFGGVSWLASSIAFLISNGAFYSLSGKFSAMSMAEYASSVAQYYPPYVSGSLIYLALAAVIYMAVNQISKAATGAARQ
jgi:hypothetical protein